LGKVRELNYLRFNIGDLVSRKSEFPVNHYCIIAFKAGERGEKVAILKSLFKPSSITEAPLADRQNLLTTGLL
jgi:hypothetical protein